MDEEVVRTSDSVNSRTLLAKMLHIEKLFKRNQVVASFVLRHQFQHRWSVAVCIFMT